MKKYGIKPDAETLDIVTTATAQKEVIVLFLCFCLAFFAVLLEFVALIWKFSVTRADLCVA